MRLVIIIIIAKGRQKNMAKRLIINARVVNNGSICEHDIFIEDGVIMAIGGDLQHYEADEVLDATGLTLIPGMSQG